MLAGAACAASMIFAAPVQAATNPEMPTAAQSYGPTVDQAVSVFYASRRGAPLWLGSGPNSPAAREFISILRRAPLDGLQSGPALAAQAEQLIANAQAGDPSALARA